ncbi:DoxX-like family protein [Chitinophaga eiseniae]|uniref:DoxX-like family protein n=1 Tax=Chitinophaga eiseniae TaxID=634771 RepID=A0A1T4T8I5_9BACT|nr:DoxX family protein [Chitinophaga eiseniae]SKA36468.1 DoxX-like family protein [Chitinophaga eiseniae]
MKKTTVLYWIFTGLLAVGITMSAIPDALSVKEARDVFQHLGYPMYLLPFLGVAKLLAVIAIVTPGHPRLKEWAYAGLVYDLTGALYSGIAVGDAATSWMFLIFFAVLAGSYIYHHKRLKEKDPSKLSVA